MLAQSDFFETHDKGWNRIKLRLIVRGLLAIAVLSVALPGSAQKKGKSRPLTTSQLMAGLVEPQFVSLKETLEAGPKDDETWNAVAASAALLNESAYIILADGRCPDKIWEQGTKVLVDASNEVLKKIAARDAKGALEAHAGIQQACKVCHTEHKYMKK
jgi:hypothetical protein